MLPHPGLRRRWSGLWHRLGAATTPDVDDVLRRWDEPHRHYHTTAHLAHCLAVYDRNPQHDDRVELALWYHDAVHDPRRSDNEERSAALAEADATAAGLAPAAIAVVSACILATRHRAAPDGPAAELTVDVDLAILGAGRRHFDRYDQAIRAEYAWVDADAYRQGRSQVLSGFAARPALFHQPWFRRRFTARAQANLRRALRRLQPIT